ncbi:LLM class flavin-dependent oxidoreductase [Streptomyces sp. NPDC048606]|uniref:LLM class flavin-dependent oxidoreductase n=1 Tax=Streptomyces sp. NPDC048606 TaxID=3154726 RepID=UPI00343F6405
MSELHLAVALDGAGWHPAAWREPGARPGELFTARYWADVVAEAEAGLLDFVTFEDGLTLQSSSPTEHDTRTDRVRGRLDAVLTAARVAPLTRHIGLVPSVTATHTEPFHISKALATLDHVSRGRAGVLLRACAPPHEAAHFGRRTFPLPVGESAEEAADHIEVVRRLWDSWEDDAEIRDVATGRFVDRDRLHHIDFVGRHFRVRGPSITPRPPQGQPLVTATAGSTAPRPGLVDLVYVAPRDLDEARAAASAAFGSEAAPRHVFADLTVLLAPDTATAAARRDRLDEAAGDPYDPEGAFFTGTPAGLAELLLEWRRAGMTGFRLRPAVLADDLPAITRGLVPELRRRGAFRGAYGAGTLRALLGLERPPNRYAAGGAGSTTHPTRRGARTPGTGRTA